VKYSTVGPVDLTRGAVGVGFGSARSSAAWVGNRYRRGRIRHQLTRDIAAAQEAIANELAVAQEVVANLPQALQEVRRNKRRRRPVLIVGAGVAVLAIGAVTFSIVRRSTQPDPSPLPPSVDIAPRP
jgi:hypothetical protein